jgi:hypothetical protein
MRDAGITLWTANRPTILAWVVLSEEGRRGFLTPDTDPLSVQTLNDAFRRRGVPLQLPLYDLEDAAAISPGEAWRQSSVATDRRLPALSRRGDNHRSGGEAVRRQLAGRLAFSRQRALAEPLGGGGQPAGLLRCGRRAGGGNAGAALLGHPACGRRPASCCDAARRAQLR